MLLEGARDSGYPLIVGLNDDASVRALKGDGRPINLIGDRIAVLEAIKHVDHICVFSGTTAVEFLRAANPAVWIKGGDYSEETLDLSERQAIKLINAGICIFPMLPDVSTTAIIEQAKT